MSQTTPRARCQAITRSGRQCKNRARPHTAYCRVHAGRVGQAASREMAFLPLLALHTYMAGFKEAEALSHERMARARVGVLMWVGLGTWLLAHLLSAGFTYVLGGSPAGWIVAVLAFVLSCGMLGRLVAGMGVASSLGFVGLNLLSMALDCLHKEGLILHLCYVVIPVLLPLWGLSRLDLAWAWVFLCYPVGMVVGWLVYTFLHAMSSD
jgi:hypothetical protein